MKYSVVLSISLLVGIAGRAQTSDMLAIAPDARAAALGYAGIATSPDAAAQHWNVAKYAFAENSGGVQFSYTPWMKNIVDGIQLLYASGYKTFGAQAVSASLHYFSAGEIESNNTWTDYTASPASRAVDLGYARRFGERFSLGVAFRYIAVDYMERDHAFALAAAHTIAADVGACYRLPIAAGEWTFGMALTNVGGSLDMGGSRVSLPANIGAGSQFAWRIADLHRLNLAADVNKPLSGGTGAAGNRFDLRMGGGAEYSYAQKIALRAGYYYDDAFGNNRSCLAFGAGLHFYSVCFDIAYWVTTGQQSVALNNTLHVTLGYTFPYKSARTDTAPSSVL
ncbi:MAG: PorV/PorQ family protein [Prevotellaceae bacterium]|jgi:hypothetical protein|nr:PorV/PorQ family protein [Prevotellaceae bacterium]